MNLKLKLSNESQVFVKEPIVSVCIHVEYPDEVYSFGSPIVSSFRGVAKCHNDNFDIEVGKSIAETKAWKKAKKYYKNIILEGKKSIEKTLANFDDTLIDIDRCIACNNKFLSKK